MTEPERSAPAYALSYRLGTGEPERHATVSGDSEEMLMLQVKSNIAEGLGRADMIVTLDPRGRFTIGAGFWSRSGFYRLEPRAVAATTSPHRPRAKG